LLHHDPKGEIKKQLYKLKKYSLSENKDNKRNIEKLAKHVAKIHACNINQNDLEIYNAGWIIEQVCKIGDSRYKNDIILASKIMSQVEFHNAPLKDNKFLTWDINRSDWQGNYETGRVGSSAWDIACIINFADDAQFSEIFLENYLRYGGTKPTLMVLYANLYYIKVFESVKNNDFENVMEITKEILEEGAFKTDIISYETLLKLKITGY